MPVLLLLLFFFAMVTQAAVPGPFCNSKTQIRRSNSRNEPICCYHTICTYNQNFVMCKEHNGHDTCVGCGKGMCTGDPVHSKNFDEPVKEICTPISSICDKQGGAIPDDTKPIKNCSCACDKANGFYGYNPHSRGCLYSTRKCGKGWELSDKKDECVPCSKDKFKPSPDGICLYKTKCSANQIEVNRGSTSEDRQCRSEVKGLITQKPMPGVINTQTTLFDPGERPDDDEPPDIVSNDQSPEISDSNKEVPIIIGVLCALLCVIGLPIVIYFWRRWRKRHRYEQVRLNIMKMEKGVNDNEGDSTTSCTSCGQSLIMCYCSFSSEHETRPKELMGENQNLGVNNSNMTIAAEVHGSQEMKHFEKNNVVTDDEAFQQIPETNSICGSKEFEKNQTRSENCGDEKPHTSQNHSEETDHDTQTFSNSLLKDSPFNFLNKGHVVITIVNQSNDVNIITGQNDHTTGGGQEDSRPSDCGDENNVRYADDDEVECNGTPSSQNSRGRSSVAGGGQSHNVDEPVPSADPHSSQSPEQDPETRSRRSDGDLRSNNPGNEGQQSQIGIVLPQKRRHEVDHRETPANDDQGTLVVSNTTRTLPGVARFEVHALERVVEGDHPESDNSQTADSMAPDTDREVYHPESAAHSLLNSLTEPLQHNFGSGPPNNFEDDDDEEDTNLMKTFES